MKKIGDYQILTKAGEGTLGDVYKGMHPRLNKIVAIKQIKAEQRGQVDSKTEVELLKNLKHTHLPQVFDLIEENGEFYTVMDFIDGSDFKALVIKGGPIPERKVRKYMLQLCSAVEYLHKQNPPIIHTDIKPANVMLDSNDNICLIDFNVSRVFGNGQSTMGGSPAYAPPEQRGIPLSALPVSSGTDIDSLCGQRTPFVNERSDIYSIGATLYFMLTGIMPSSNYVNKPITECGVKISDGMAHIITKAMALNPARRYGSASKMINAVNNIGKLEKPYIALKIRREIATAASVIAIAAGVWMAGTGRSMMLSEREDKYSGYLESITRQMDSGDAAAASETIALAAELFPTRLEPYYCNLLIMHENGLHEECAAYPDKIITEDKLLDAYNSDVIKSNMYAVAGDSAFALEDYAKAGELYRKAIDFCPDNPDCYRDAAISYAKQSDIGRARIMLNKAQELGVSSSQLSLVRGEINSQTGKYDEAFQNFSDCAETADDSYILFRALIACDNMAVKAGGAFGGGASKTAAFLEQNLSRVSDDYKDIVTELLANEYFRCAEELSDDSYLSKAADCYKQLFDANRLNFALEKNYYNLLERLGRYAECRALLEKMSSEREDYWIMMNFSWLCITVENLNPDTTERDYREAYTHFLEAQTLYNKYLHQNPGASDVNMNKLSVAIKEIQDAHYLD